MWKAHFSVSGFLDCHQSKSASPSGKLHARIIRRSAPRARTFWHLIFRARAILPGDRKGIEAMDWNNPEARLALLERVDANEYNRLHSEKMKADTVETVNGHAIHKVQSGFGQLFAVGATNRAFKTMEEARAFAGATKPGVAAIELDDIGRASQIDDVDAALLALMNIAGIDDGGVAGIVFSGFDWNGASQSERVDQLAEWIRTERSYEKQES